MSEGRHPLAHEEQIVKRTQAENPTEVSLTERFFHYVVDGFNRIERPLRREEPRETILLLATMGHNSLRWAWELLLKGYYVQANALSRTGWECWLHGAYLLLYPEDLDTWRDFETRKRPSEMRRLVAERSGGLESLHSDEFRTGMDQLYSDYSEYVHPSNRALRVLVAEQDGKQRLCLGGEYDALLMVQSTHMFCNAALMLSTLLDVLLPGMAEYTQHGHKLGQELAAWRRAIEHRSTGAS